MAKITEGIMFHTKGAWQRHKWTDDGGHRIVAGNFASKDDAKEHLAPILRSKRVIRAEVKFNKYIDPDR